MKTAGVNLKSSYRIIRSLPLGLGELVQTHPLLASDAKEFVDLLACIASAHDVRHLACVEAWGLAHLLQEDVELLGGVAVRSLDTTADTLADDAVAC